MWYKNSKIIFENDHIFSLLFFFVIATDPIFIIQLKLDIGPTVLQNFFIALTFYLYLMCINQRFYILYYKKSTNNELHSAITNNINCILIICK
jgi:hypothetical protein